MKYTHNNLREMATKLEAIADQLERYDEYDDELAAAKDRVAEARADAQRMGEENSRLCDEIFELERKLKEASCA